MKKENQRFRALYFVIIVQLIIIVFLGAFILFPSSNIFLQAQSLDNSTECTIVDGFSPEQIEKIQQCISLIEGIVD